MLQEIEYLEGDEFEASDEDVEDYGDYSDSQGQAAPGAGCCAGRIPRCALRRPAASEAPRLLQQGRAARACCADDGENGAEQSGRAAGPAEAGSDSEDEAAAPVRPGGKRKGAAPAPPAKAMAPNGAKRRTRGRVEIEYEMEREDLRQLGRR